MDKNSYNNDSEPECKFCLQEDKITNLISPCKCDGSMKYVHTKCLDMFHKKKYLEHCDICKEKYEYNTTLDKLKYKSLLLIYSVCILNNFFSTIITFDLNNFYMLIFIFYMMLYHNLFISNKLFEVDIIKNKKISNPTNHHSTYTVLNCIYHNHIKFCLSYTFTYKILNIWKLIPNPVIKNFYKILYLFTLIISIIKLNKKINDLSYIKIIKSITNKKI